MTQTLEQPKATTRPLSVIVGRPALLDIASNAKPLTNSRTPALRCVRLRTSVEDGLTVEATDLTTFVTFTLKAVQVERAGECLVDCDKLGQCLREMTGDFVTIGFDGNLLSARTDYSEIKLATLPTKDYPNVSLDENENGVTLPAKTLRAAIADTVFSVAETQGRYSFTGLMFDRKKKSLSLCGCDGRWMSVVEMDAPAGTPWSAIMPENAARLVDRLLEDEEEATVSTSGSRVQVACDNFTLLATQLEGSFPPYEDAIPKDFDKRISAAKGELLSALRQACVVANNDGIHAKVVIHAKKAGVTIRANSETGTANVTVSCKYEGQSEIEIGLSAKRLIEGIGHAPGEEVFIDLVTPNRAVLVTGLASANKPTYRYAQFPMNLQ